MQTLINDLIIVFIYIYIILIELYKRQQIKKYYWWVVFCVGWLVGWFVGWLVVCMLGRLSLICWLVFTIYGSISSACLCHHSKLHRLHQFPKKQPKACKVSSDFPIQSFLYFLFLSLSTVVFPPKGEDDWDLGRTSRACQQTMACLWRPHRRSSTHGHPYIS